MHAIQLLRREQAAIDRRLFPTSPSVNTAQPVIGVTFDDDPDPRSPSGLLALLAEFNAPGAVEVEGRRVPLSSLPPDRPTRPPARSAESDSIDSSSLAPEPLFRTATPPAAGPPPDISVIIPCFNGSTTLPAQLDALAQQVDDVPSEIIVADNGSTDNLPAVIEMFRERLPQLRLVDAADVQGPAHARNVGVLAAHAPFLAFCDADDIVADGWLSALARAFKIHDFVAGPHDLSRLNPDWTHSTRDLSDNLLTGDYFPYAGAGNMGIRRAVFLAVRGFREDLAYLEDVEFCWRVQKEGTPLTFVPDAVVHVRLHNSLWLAFTQSRCWALYSLFIRQLHGLPIQTRYGLRAVLRHDLPKQCRTLLQVRSRKALYRWVVKDLGTFVGTVQALWRHRRGAVPAPEMTTGILLPPPRPQTGPQTGPAPLLKHTDRT